MTGFGAAEGSVLGGRLSVEIRTVHLRCFNPQLRVPFERSGIEAPLREGLGERLGRGHVAVSARWLEPPAGNGAVALDLGRARQVVAAARELKKRLKLKGEIDLAFVARQPEVFAVPSDGERVGAAAGAAWEAVAPLVERAAEQVLAMRGKEGRALAAELGGRLAAPGALGRAGEQRGAPRLRGGTRARMNGAAGAAAPRPG